MVYKGIFECYIKSQTININVFKFKIGKVLPYILATKIDINNFKVK